MAYHYQKLIRDKDPDIAKRRRQNIEFHYATTDQEYEFLLFEKLQEELDEFKQRSRVVDIADVLDVLDAIIEFKGFDRKEIQAVIESQRAARGTFSRRLVLDKAEGPVGEPQEQ